MKSFRVAIILPSRGLIFSQTAEEIVDNVKGLPHKFFFAHKLPIPQCFEKPTRVALSDPSITHLWFVEDDMILPPDTLTRLLEADVHAIACDYPVSKEGQGALFEDKEVIFSGTGCLLVKREVFEGLKKPYFTDKIRWGALNYGDHVRFVANQSGKSFDGYGLHDVTFGIRLYVKGTPIKKADFTLGQRKLVALGKAGTNEGAHNIEEWTKVKPNFLFKKLKKLPPMPQGDLVHVQTPSGEVMTDKDHAKKLIKAGLATKNPKRNIVVDPGDLL